MCGETFPATRSHAKYCSAGCRTSRCLINKMMKRLIKTGVDEDQRTWNRKVMKAFEEHGFKVIHAMVFLKRDNYDIDKRLERFAEKHKRL